MRPLILTFISLLFFLSSIYGQESKSTKSYSKIWEEQVVLPTYLVDPPDINPRFYDGRAYQGAQGRVYPYPIYESLSDTRVEKEYDMVYLENEYIKINILPEIGGRLFGALDKTNDYDFIYRQTVIKPALIGMLGAWISGGIEWNFPHHHRATAYMPVDYVMVENDDGSSTVWIGELEIRHRIKFMLGLTVYPGKSYFEVTFKPFNRTPFIHSFLYFANTGVHTNEDYQVIFPPSTQFGVYHGKNQFVKWPIANEVYNSVDYTEGVDISWWKNHPEWTSIFAWNNEDDFVGGYDHGQEAGIICLSNHHIAPGKKFWTWSTGPRGQMWDEALTETDGPELELMIGGYSDNQPDYSWLQPYETKYLRQYFYPIRGIGSVKNANLEAAVNLERIDNNKVMVGFNTTSRKTSAKVILKRGKEVLIEEIIDIDPGHPYTREFKIPEKTPDTDLSAILYDAKGEELIKYSPEKLEDMEMPEEAVPPKPPAEIETIEELYLTGLRLEQFHNPSFRPEPYYNEALSRDPHDYRVNVAMGLNLLQKGEFKSAENYFQTAVDRITNNHTKARDGEAYYYLGICQQLEGKFEEAYKNLYQATWSQAFHTASYYHLAQLDSRKGNIAKALEHLERSLSTNTMNSKASNLMSVLLRRSGEKEKSLEIARKNISKDPLDVWAHYEYLLASEELENSTAIAEAALMIAEKFENYEQTWIELSLDYAAAGLWEEAIRVLKDMKAPAKNYALVDYYLGYYMLKMGDREGAMKAFNNGAGKSPDYCFPFRLEAMEVLNTAINMNPNDSKALFYLGNLLFEWQPDEAILAWEKSRDINPNYSLVHRNLGWAYYKIEQDLDKAIESYEKAIALNPEDQRLLYELDVVYADGRVSPEKRLKLLQTHHEMIADNNVADALAREVMLLVQLGKYNEALQVAENNYFRQWEGVSKAYASYVDAYLLRGIIHYNEGRYQEALSDFLSAAKYPDNMMVAEPYRGGRSAQVDYYIASAYDALEDTKQAVKHYELSASKRQRPTYSEIHYYKALSLRKLGKDEEAEEIFDGLIELGRSRLENPEEDFFAKFGERETAADKKADAHFLIALGHLGNGNQDAAMEELEQAVELNSNHIWANAMLKESNSGSITLY